MGSSILFDELNHLIHSSQKNHILNRFFFNHLIHLFPLSVLGCLFGAKESVVIA